jgi:hypothetical protein
VESCATKQMANCWASKPARSLCDAAKSADKGGQGRSDNLGGLLRKKMNAFHLDFFLIGQGPAEGDLVRTVIQGAWDCMEIELGHRAGRQPSRIILDRLDHIGRFARNRDLTRPAQGRPPILPRVQEGSPPTK